MHSRMSTSAALTLVLPHPPLPRRQSSLLKESQSQASSPRTPHTPLMPAAPPPLLFGRRSMSSPRTSTDSWNSMRSEDDEVQWEWTPEQISLLSRTLDALPRNVLTPFNASMPPSNLLDKIARGLVTTKGPMDWPHSIRHTRAKLSQLAKERAQEKRRLSIDEEDEDEEDVIKRPLYRRSSMDFLPNKKENKTLDRLSTRLQRTDRIITHTSYHPYARPSSRSPSPPATVPNPELLSPLSAVSRPSPIRTRLSSSSLTPSRIPTLRRTASVHSNPGTPATHASPTKSSVTGQGLPFSAAAIRIKRSDSFNHPPPTLKRAPSYASARTFASTKEEAVKEKDSGASSDEEEKTRQKRAKRVKTSKAETPKPATPRSKDAKTSSPRDKTKKKEERPKQKRPPSFLGPELPQPLEVAPELAIPPHKPSAASLAAPQTQPKVRTLRRVGTSPFPSRRTSPVPGEVPTLGSAFELKP